MPNPEEKPYFTTKHVCKIVWNFLALFWPHLSFIPKWTRITTLEATSLHHICMPVRGCYFQLVAQKCTMFVNSFYPVTTNTGCRTSILYIRQEKRTILNTAFRLIKILQGWAIALSLFLCSFALFKKSDKERFALFSLYQKSERAHKRANHSFLLFCSF